MNIYIYICIHVYLDIHIYVCIYLYIYIYIAKSEFWKQDLGSERSLARKVRATLGGWGRDFETLFGGFPKLGLPFWGSL